METLKQERDRLRNVENTINESSKTLRIQPVGGLGAMTQRINAKPVYEKKPTTISFASPGVSSLPYLSDEQKVKSNENILMLAVHHAQQREAVKAHYIDLDKKQADLEDRIENDITTFTKNYEPSTENLLKNFLLGEIKKRNAEEQELIKKRMERADLELNPPARIPERRRFGGFFDADGETLFSRDSNLDQSLVNRELARRAREGDEERALNERERRLDEADDSVSQLMPVERRGVGGGAGTEVSNYPPSEGGAEGFLRSVASSGASTYERFLQWGSRGAYRAVPRAEKQVRAERLASEAIRRRLGRGGSVASSRYPPSEGGAEGFLPSLAGSRVSAGSDSSFFGAVDRYYGSGRGRPRSTRSAPVAVAGGGGGAVAKARGRPRLAPEERVGARRAEGLQRLGLAPVARGRGRGRGGGRGGRGGAGALLKPLAEEE